MKVYIRADIEGIVDIVNWDEATRWKPDYPFTNPQAIFPPNSGER